MDTPSIHFNTRPGLAQSRAEVEALTDEQLNEFMGMCEIEPADFDNCLACYAYEVVQERDERGVNIVDSTSTFNLLILTVTVTAPLSQTVQVSEHMAPRVRALLEHKLAEFARFLPEGVEMVVTD